MGCTEATGGLLVMDDSFTHGVFINSIKGTFARDETDNNDLLMAFRGELKVLTSRDLKVRGVIGPVTSMGKKNDKVSTEEIGIGGTYVWKIGGLDPNVTLAVYFEIVNQNIQQTKDVRQAYMQFITKYKHSSGREHLRVTTIAKTCATANEQGLGYIRAGFDQECATVLITRRAAY